MVKKTGIKLLSAALGVMMLAGASHAQQIVERTTNASGGSNVVDWGDSYLEVTGRATAELERSQVRMRLKSLAAARVLAQAQLLEVIKGVEIVAGSKVEDFILTDQRAASRVRGTLQNAVVVSEEITWNEYPDGTREPEAAVTMRVCFRDNAPACRSGGSNRGLLRSMGKQGLRGGDEPRDLFAPSDEQKQQAEQKVKQETEEEQKEYNSLVVVIDGLAFDPVLAPQLVTSGGQLVYGVDNIEPDALFSNGPVQFANTVENARSIELIQAEPLVVNAASISEDGHIVLADEDAAKVLAANTVGGNFLNNARVALVLK